MTLENEIDRLRDECRTLDSAADSLRKLGYGEEATEIYGIIVKIEKRIDELKAKITDQNEAIWRAVTAIREMYSAFSTDAENNNQ